MPNGTYRNSHGITISILVVALGVFVLGLFGVFSYEFTRVNLARQQLQHVCEASALAAAAAMPSPWQYLNPDTWFGIKVEEGFPVAETAAQQIFVSNSVLGNWLNNTAFSDSRTSSAAAARHTNPQANDACMYIEFLKPNGSVDPWIPGTPAAVTVHVIGTFGELPSFGAYCGIGKVVVVGDATAPIPWVHAFRSDWKWLGNSDPLDGGQWTIGDVTNPNSPNPWVDGNGILNIAETPGGFLSTGTGFHQRYGYIQTFARVNGHSWTKFWLENPGGAAIMPRIEIVDSFGGDNTAYTVALQENANATTYGGNTERVKAAVDLSTSFHAYGVLWRPDDSNLYFLFDHKIVAKLPKYTDTDLNQLQIAIGNSTDSVFDTSTGKEPPAQFASVDAWQFGNLWNPQNDNWFKD